MPTGQQVVTAALTTLGINEQGGVPSASDSQDALDELNRMWESWGIDEGLVYSEQPFTSPALTTTVASYTIGTGATWNTARPQRIYKAYYVLGANRNELDIVNADRYFSHNDLTAAAATPDELYPDFNDDSSGFAKIYLWPVPTFGSGAPAVQLVNAVTFSTWTLGGTYNIPYGYFDAINYALALRLLPRFGSIVPAEVAQRVSAEGGKAELRLRTASAKNRIQPPPAMDLTPLSQPAGAPR